MTAKSQSQSGPRKSCAGRRALYPFQKETQKQARKGERAHQGARFRGLIFLPQGFIPFHSHCSHSACTRCSPTALFPFRPSLEKTQIPFPVPLNADKMGQQFQNFTQNSGKTKEKEPKETFPVPKRESKKKGGGSRYIQISFKKNENKLNWKKQIFSTNNYMPDIQALGRYQTLPEAPHPENPPLEIIGPILFLLLSSSLYFP